MPTLAQERERAQSLATRIVAFSIGLMGVVLMVFAVVLTVRGGAALVLLSVILFLLGAFVAAMGFFFQLVPFRLQELASLKREHDAVRGAKSPRDHEGSGRDGDE